jgi:hypothetical protein
MSHRQIIESYFSAFRERDRERLRAVLMPDVHHAGSFGEWRDRDAMIDAIWPGVGQVWASNLRIFGESPEFFVRYQHEALAGVRPRQVSMAEYVRFEADRIAEVEVYIGREVPTSEGS